MALLLPFVAAFSPRPAVSRMASVLRPETTTGVSMKHDGAQSSSVPCFESIQTKLEAGGLPGSIGVPCVFFDTLTISRTLAGS